MHLFQIIHLIVNFAFLILIAIFMTYGIRAMTVYIENNKKSGCQAVKISPAEKGEGKEG